MSNPRTTYLREGPVKITKTTIDGAWRRRAPGQRLEVSDAACPGLCLVVNSTGMAWRFHYKPRGLDAATGKRFASRSVTLGSPETHSPDDARAEAGKLKGQAKAGADIAGQKRARIAAEAVSRSRTMDRLAEDYAAVLPRRRRLRGTGKLSPDYIAAEASRLKAGIADMKVGGKSVAEVDAADLRALLRATADQPGAARHRFGALSRFFDWACDEGLLMTNPCDRISKERRPKPIRARQTYMKPAELAQLWHAAGEAEGLEAVHRDFIRFLIAVPCRRSEAAGMRWEQLDLGGAEWLQHETLTKNDEMHRFYLHSLALDLLKQRHQTASKPATGPVFPGPRSGVPLTTFSFMKRALAKKAEAADWRMHDFRRSFATALGEAGFQEVILDAVLNHKQAATRGGVLGVYQRAQRWPEQRSAMIAWGRTLEAAIKGTEGNVVTLTSAREAQIA